MERHHCLLFDNPFCSQCLKTPDNTLLVVSTVFFDSRAVVHLPVGNLFTNTLKLIFISKPKSTLVCTVVCGTHEASLSSSPFTSTCPSLNLTPTLCVCLASLSIQHLHALSSHTSPLPALPPPPTTQYSSSTHLSSSKEMEAILSLRVMSYTITICGVKKPLKKSHVNIFPESQLSKSQLPPCHWPTL